MLTPEEVQNIRFLETDEIAQRLHCDAVRVGWYRKAGLLKYRRLGKHCLTTEEEYAEFVYLTQGMDLSNRDKVRLAGIELKKAQSDKTKALN